MEKNNKKLDFGRALKRFRKLNVEGFYFIGAKLKCTHCNNEFGIDREYMGIITCPYCGKYVEG